MLNVRQGSIHLFRIAGIDLFLHWSWFLVAAFEIQYRANSYSTLSWNVLEYLSLFLIVTLHEFGHALACRQVGGTANRILLWPFGGVAYVDPPPRPGATLWSIAAGPLVNVAILAILLALRALGQSMGWLDAVPNLHAFLGTVWLINLGLLIFNMLPVYPLDGGQILRSLLWFVMGRAHSLMVATILGLIGIAGFVCLAFWMRSVWLGILSVFLLMNCWGGLRRAQALLRMAKLPRHTGFACPWCKAAPPVGDFWVCGQCKKPFDTFRTQALCPNCAAQFAATVCMDCGRRHPMRDWIAPVVSHPIG